MPSNGSRQRLLQEGPFPQGSLSKQARHLLRTLARWLSLAGDPQPGLSGRERHRASGLQEGRMSRRILIRDQQVDEVVSI